MAEVHIFTHRARRGGTPRGAGPAEPSTLDTENTQLRQLWELLLRLSCAEEARPGERGPMQLKGPLQGGLRQRHPLPAGR